VTEFHGCSRPGRRPRAELVPFSADKLRGELVLHEFRWIETWTKLIALCGGQRFHYMDLPVVSRCVPILLDACVETLKILRFYGEDGSSGKSSRIRLSADLS